MRKELVANMFSSPFQSLYLGLGFDITIGNSACLKHHLFRILRIDKRFLTVKEFNLDSLDAFEPVLAFKAFFVNDFCHN